MTRRSGLIVAVAIVLIAVIAAVVVSGGDDEAENAATATPAPTVAATATAATVASPVAASPVASPIASPAGSPVASPAAEGSPAAQAGWTRSVTRDQFQEELLARFRLEAPANTGGRVILGESSDISTVNGILAQDELTFQIVGAIYEPLVGASPIDGRPVPVLADYWEVSPDGLTYVFHLSKEAKWQDGTDFTAEDVKFSFDVVLDPNTGSTYTGAVNDVVASYRVVDPDTFEITARDRLVNFLYEGPGAVLIMPKHLWQDVGTESWSFNDGSTGKDPSRVIGTGPFKFKEWVQGDHVTIVRNPDYYDQPPYIDELILQVQPNADTAVLALKNGETDIMQILPPAQTEEVRNTPGLKVEIYDILQFTFYAFNLDPARTPLFQDKLVRQALFTALDREAITRDIFLGFGEPAIGTQPRMSPAYAPDRMSPDYAYDPQQAQDLLAQAGWTDSDDDGTLDKDGVEFSFDLTYAGGDATVDQIVAYIQEAWRSVGVKVDVNSVAFDALVEAIDKRDFDVLLVAFGISPDGNQSQLFSCDAYDNGFNFMRFCNPEYDRLDELQKREFDPAKRAELLIQQSQIVWEEQPVGVIRFGVARTGYNARLRNFYPNGYGFLWSLPYVWVAP